MLGSNDYGHRICSLKVYYNASIAQSLPNLLTTTLNVNAHCANHINGSKPSGFVSQQNFPPFEFIVYPKAKEAGMPRTGTLFSERSIPREPAVARGSS